MEKDNLTKLKRANRFAMKSRFKVKQNLELAGQINEFLEDHSITKERLETEDVNGQREALLSLIKLRDNLMKNRSYHALFEDGKDGVLVLLSQFYNKHPLDFLWNMRRSQIIRSKLFHFLPDALHKSGERLVTACIPVHMVLTVPRQNGVWRGKRFYAVELKDAFRELRNQRFWREGKHIYAGIYCMEVKASKNKRNGLHIHLHVFLLQEKDVTVNEMREKVERHWRSIVGNYSDYSGIHYETLYVPKRDKNNRPVFKNVIENGQPKRVMEKDYIRPGDPLEKYIYGVLECIKYHYKPGVLEEESTVKGKYDIPLILEILGNKGLRMYDKFGAFHSEKALNFNQLKTDDEDLNGDSAKAERELVNPLTLKLALEGEYKLGVGYLDRMQPIRKDGGIIGFRATGSNDLIELPQGLSIKEAIAYDLKRGAMGAVYRQIGQPEREFLGLKSIRA